MRSHLAEENHLDNAVYEALDRQGPPSMEKFAALKEEMAGARGFRIGDDGIAGVVGAMVESVVESHWVETVRVSEDVLRQKTLAVMRKHLGPEASEVKMTPQLEQAIKLLQLSRMELEQIRREMEQNPILEPSPDPDEGNDDDDG